ncbi:Dolichyl-diphosphooligosaccharide-protein glycosyltransferase subunit [Athelia psychrophila]|uniref:Dolichyl-diphosphooligosaccharide--protein glycosyltransferase subunit WBP1 n=1 Tax=Athelia psychrophila TaxID=1759441 RepID=A0A166VE87_9AGAM|nr:Dolichyl-diphosphooligosaccharide-protein glycosyltransferase subunit [Fibularhizoctonia sp. CBS 109695]
MLALWSLLLPLAGLAGLVHAKSSSGDSVLVVLEPGLPKEDFSVFFSNLKEQGYDLTFRAPKEVTPKVIEDDIPAFAHVILFAPESKAYAADITPQSLVTLLSEKTNLLVAVGPKTTPLTSLASEFSLILPTPNTPLISHFPKRDTPATVIPIEVASNSLLTAGTPPVWFSGVSYALGNNPLLVPILAAPAESFASDSTEDSGADALVDASEKGGEGLWAGSATSVVTGFQTKDGSRVTWVGSVTLFSDEFAHKALPNGKASGNEQFAKDVAAWTFQEKSVLRIESVSHHHVNGTSTPDFYTTNDEIVYSVKVSKYDPKTSSWKPCTCRSDIQLEFTMLDPHVRTTLVADPSDPGSYTASFRAPDRHGVFKFVIDYKRKGWSSLQSSTTVPVVPPRHDGYPRFLSAAWPYYAGAISTSVGFVVFSALFLAGDVRDVKKGKGLKHE